MASATLDPTAVRAQQRRIWDGVSAGWQRWQREFEAGAAPVTVRLMRSAGVRPGHRVLDVGSGAGEPAMSSGRAVAPHGRVVGIDLSPAMVAAARAAARGVANVEFLLGDVETAPLPPSSFDIALSRWGLMFAADRVELLQAVGRLLVRGGVLAAAVWAQPERVPLISLAFRVITEQLELGPPPPGPGPFTMANPEAVTAELERAGWRSVRIEERVAAFRFASVDDFAAFSRDVLPPGMTQLLEERCGSVAAAEVWDRFAGTARRYRVPGGSVVLPSSYLSIRAVARGG